MFLWPMIVPLNAVVSPSTVIAARLAHCLPLPILHRSFHCQSLSLYLFCACQSLSCILALCPVAIIITAAFSCIFIVVATLPLLVSPTSECTVLHLNRRCRCSSLLFYHIAGATSPSAAHRSFAAVWRSFLLIYCLISHFAYPFSLSSATRALATLRHISLLCFTVVLYSFVQSSKT